MKTGHYTVGILRLLAACLALVNSVCFSVAAGEATSTVTHQLGPPLQIPLEWQEWAESSGSLDTYPLRFSPKILSFLKEPDFNQHRVVRGAFGCGVRTNDQIKAYRDKIQRDQESEEFRRKLRPYWNKYKCPEKTPKAM